MLYITLKPANGHHFAGDIFRCIFLNENIVLFLIRISLKFVREGIIDKHWFRWWPGAPQAIQPITWTNVDHDARRNMALLGLDEMRRIPLQLSEDFLFQSKLKYCRFRQHYRDTYCGLVGRRTAAMIFNIDSGKLYMLFAWSVSSNHLNRCWIIVVSPSTLLKYTCILLLIVSAFPF